MNIAKAVVGAVAITITVSACNKTPPPPTIIKMNEHFITLQAYVGTTYISMDRKALELCRFYGKSKATFVGTVTVDYWYLYACEY